MAKPLNPCVSLNGNKMSLSLEQIEQAAEQIIKKLESGELKEGCCMASIQTPVTEAWELAGQLTENDGLLDVQKQELFSQLDKSVQLQLKSSGYDDFDLVYERLIQLCDHCR